MEPCELCGRPYTVRHHVFFGTANRRISEQEGMVAWLCPACHTDGALAVHRCRMTDLRLKRRYQEIFEQTHTREEFRAKFGRSYL